MFISGPTAVASTSDSTYTSTSANFHKVTKEDYEGLSEDDIEHNEFVSWLLSFPTVQELEKSPQYKSTDDLQSYVKIRLYNEWMDELWNDPLDSSFARSLKIALERKSLALKCIGKPCTSSTIGIYVSSDISHSEYEQNGYDPTQYVVVIKITKSDDASASASASASAISVASDSAASASASATSAVSASATSDASDSASATSVVASAFVNEHYLEDDDISFAQLLIEDLFVKNDSDSSLAGWESFYSTEERKYEKIKIYLTPEMKHAFRNAPLNSIWLVYLVNALSRKHITLEENKKSKSDTTAKYIHVEVSESDDGSGKEHEKEYVVISQILYK